MNKFSFHLILHICVCTKHEQIMKCIPVTWLWGGRLGEICCFLFLPRWFGGGVGVSLRAAALGVCFHGRRHCYLLGPAAWPRFGGVMVVLPPGSACACLDRCSHVGVPCSVPSSTVVCLVPLFCKVCCLGVKLGCFMAKGSTCSWCFCLSICRGGRIEENG